MVHVIRLLVPSPLSLGRAGECIKFGFVAVEYIYIHFAVYAPYATIRTELPEAHTHIWFVFPIAGYPHLIVSFHVRCQIKVAVHKHLTDVEDGAHARFPLHNFQPSSHFPPKHGCSSHPLDLPWRRFHIKHRWEVAFSYPCMAEEKGSLCRSSRSDGKEMIGAGM